MSQNVIRVVGAREHNLKNITVEIPRDKLVVITGLSGSGKSSLAFDTIFAEGQRRYVESLSAYAAPVSGPDGTSPMSITSRACRRQSRSTRKALHTTHAPQSARSPKSMTTCACCLPAPVSRTARSAGAKSPNNLPRKLSRNSKTFPEGARLLILSPLVRGRKGHPPGGAGRNPQVGICARPGRRAVVHELDEDIQMDRYKIHTIEAVVDRLVIQHAEEAYEAQAVRSRLTDSSRDCPQVR